jgi:hypothetical protein
MSLRLLPCACRAPDTHGPSLLTPLPHQPLSPPTSSPTLCPSISPTPLPFPSLFPSPPSPPPSLRKRHAGFFGGGRQATSRHPPLLGPPRRLFGILQIQVRPGRKNPIKSLAPLPPFSPSPLSPMRAKPLAPRLYPPFPALEHSGFRFSGFGLRSEVQTAFAACACDALKRFRCATPQQGSSYLTAFEAVTCSGWSPRAPRDQWIHPRPSFVGVEETNVICAAHACACPRSVGFRCRVGSGQSDLVVFHNRGC